LNRNIDTDSDEINGFKKDGSTTDPELCITNLIKAIQKVTQSTFCAFIDFKKGIY
jgi:hypothetical protein